MSTENIPPTNQESEYQKQLLSILDNSEMDIKSYWRWFVSSGGTLMDGISIMIIGISLHLLSNKLDSFMIGMIGAALLLGAVFGSNIGGSLADTLGRKKILIANMLIMASGAVLSIFSFSPWLLFAGQLIIGLGIGSDFAVSSTYISETTPIKKRSVLMITTIAFQSAGLILAGVLAWIILDILNVSNIWQYLFAIEVLFSLFFFISRFTIFESPRWLMTKGKNTEALEIIQKMHPEQSQTFKGYTPLVGSEVHKVALPLKLKDKDKEKYSLIFTKTYIKRTILAAVPWFLMDIATYGVGLFTPIILASLINESKLTVLKVQEMHNVLGSTLIDLFLLFGFLLAMYFVPKYGKIKMQIIGFGGMVIGMAMLFLASYWHLQGTEYKIVVFGGFILFNLLMNMGPNATTFALPTELFPTNVRSTGSGFSAGFAKIGATLGVFLFPIFKDEFGTATVLAGVSIISLIGVLVTVIFSEELKESQSLETYHRKQP